MVKPATIKAPGGYSNISLRAFIVLLLFTFAANSMLLPAYSISLSPGTIKSKRDAGKTDGTASGTTRDKVKADAKDNDTNKITPVLNKGGKVKGAEHTWPEHPSAEGIKSGRINPDEEKAMIEQVEAGDGTPVLTLSDALDQSLDTSPQVPAWKAQLGITKAGYWQATQMPNPILFRDEGAYAEQVRRLGPWLTYDPPWHSIFRLLSTKQGVKEKRLEILNGLWQLRNNVRRAYTEEVVARESYETLKVLAEIAGKLNEVTHNRFLAGAVPELDVMRAELAFYQADVARIKGLRRLVRAKEMLNVILGRDAKAPVQLERISLNPDLSPDKTDLLPNFKETVPPLEYYINIALNHRLELKIIHRQIEQNRALLRQAYGDIVPDPMVAIGSSSAGNPPSGPQFKAFFITMNFDLPVYGHNAADSAYRITYQIKQLQKQMLAQRNLVIADVSAAYKSYTIARHRLQIYQERLITESEQVTDLARYSYQVGFSDFVSTLAAQQANFQIRSQYLDTISDYEDAVTDLEQSIGEPLP